MFRQTDVSFTVLFGTLTASSYVAFYILFVVLVVKEFHVLHGYPRQKDLLPGPFVSDRYSWSWYFLMLNMARPFVFSFYEWTFLGLRSSRKRVWFERTIGYTLAWDVVMWVFFLIVWCFFCNNSFASAASSLCNDELSKWCTVFGSSFPDRCPPSLPPVDQCPLEVNPIFMRWVYFHVGFCILDLLLWYFNGDMITYIREALYWT